MGQATGQSSYPIQMVLLPVGDITEILSVSEGVEMVSLLICAMPNQGMI